MLPRLQAAMMAAAITLVLGASSLGGRASIPSRAEPAAAGVASAAIKVGASDRRLTSTDRQGPWAPPEAAWDGDCRSEGPGEDDGCQETAGMTPRVLLAELFAPAEAPDTRARPPLPSPSRFLGLQRFRC